MGSTLRNVNLLLCIVACLAASPLQAQISTGDLLQSMKIGKLEHPYLLFSETEKPVLLQRIKSDPECRNIMAGLLAEGNRFLSVPVKEFAPLPPKHSRYFIADDAATSYLSEISNGAFTLSFLYQMTGDVTYAKKAIEFAIAISDLADWVNPAHKFDIIYSRVWPRNVPDDQVVFSYDITSAGRAMTLSIAYDWLYPVLTKAEKDKIRNGLLEKAITRVRGNYDFFWWSSAYRCNWSAICYAGVGLTALALFKENPQLLDVVAEAHNRMNLTFNEIGEDGGWQEGPGYYSYMMRMSVMFMDALKRATGGKYNLFLHKNIKDHPFDFFLFGLTANFEDSGGGPLGPTYVVDKLVEETRNATGAWYRDNFLREGDVIYDILWPRTSVAPVKPDQASKLFRSIDWALMRSDFLDPSTLTVACKAGFNDDPHHGHLDCGHFIVTWYDVAFIRDLGRMVYDERYFSEDRYSYPYATSAGHNVITVNGEEQIIAKKKNQPWKEGVGGRILDFRTGAQRDYVVMDPTHAYPGRELKHWKRHIVLEKPAITVVLDEVEALPGADVRARFFPGVGTGTGGEFRRTARARANPSADGVQFTSEIGEYRVLDNHVYLSDGRRHNMALIPLALENECKIIEGKIPAIPVTENARLTWLPYVETVVKAKSTTSTIVTIVLPAGDQKEAQRIAGSAVVRRMNGENIEISVEPLSGKHTWTFEKGRNGLVLKE
jgi:hypothetical protein